MPTIPPLTGGFHVCIQAVAHHCRFLPRGAGFGQNVIYTVSLNGFPTNFGSIPVACVIMQAIEPQSGQNFPSSSGQTRSRLVARKGTPAVMRREIVSAFSKLNVLYEPQHRKISRLRIVRQKRKPRLLKLRFQLRRACKINALPPMRPEIMDHHIAGSHDIPTCHT